MRLKNGTQLIGTMRYFIDHSLSFLFLTASWQWGVHAFSLVPKRYVTNIRSEIVVCHAAVVAPEMGELGFSALNEALLGTMASEATSSKEYSQMFGLSDSDAGFFGLFHAMRTVGIAYALQGQPFVLRKDEITKALDLNESPFAGFFTIQDLARALEDDFLDAARGSTDNRKGWKVRIF
jgi:hypothetical protein